MHGTVGNSSDSDWSNANRAFVPKALSKGEPLVLEHVVTGPQEAIEIVGKIVSSGQAELQDLVVHVDCFDADGAPVDASETGLTKADSGRYFFYPLGLMAKTENSFCKRFITPLGARRIHVSLSVWRNWGQLEFQAQGFEIRPADVLHVPEGSHFSDLISLLINQAGIDPSGRVLDVATTLPEPDLTISAMARTFSLPIDCMALMPNPKHRWMDTRRMLDECRIRPTPAGPYVLICIYPHIFNLGNLLAQLPALFRHLSSHGVVISVVRVPDIDALPQPGRKPSDDPGSLPARIDALNAECLRRAIPLEVLVLTPKGSSADQYWVVLRKTQLYRLIPALDTLQDVNNLPAAAAIMYDALVPVVQGRREPIIQLELAKQFEAAVPALDRDGRYDDALKCLLCAAALHPSNLALNLELAGRFRVREDYVMALAIVEHLRQSHSDNPSILINLALVFSLTGRGLEAMDIAEQFLIRTGQSVSLSGRRAITTLLRNFARECQCLGQTSNLTEPLLDPEITQVFLSDPEKHSEVWFQARLNRLFHGDALERSSLRAVARRTHKHVASDRKLRVLIISQGPWPFVLKMIRQLNLRSDEIEFRTFDFAAIDDNIRREHSHEGFAPVSIGGDSEATWSRIASGNQVLVDLVDWCDIVFCEWAGFSAAWLSRYLPPHKRLVVRLHSYEAFTSWPYFINFGGIDGMIFVADHVRRITDVRFRFSTYCPRSTVLQNFNDPSDFSSFKEPGANRVLGMLGYANLNKDPLFAARILARLRESDSTWRLMLVGKNWDESSLKDAELDYYRGFRAFVDQNGLDGAIEYVDFTTQIQEPLAKIGFILSCSHREGTHEAILEGMSSGAVPVIRRWPMVSKFGAPDSFYPGLACVDSVDEAVTQILTNADPQRFSAASAEATAYAHRQFDPAVTMDAFLQFLKDILADEE